MADMALSVNQDIASRVFDVSYKRKDDLIALAGALAPPMEGALWKVPVNVIEDYLEIPVELIMS